MLRVVLLNSSRETLVIKPLWGREREGREGGTKTDGLVSNFTFALSSVLHVVLRTYPPQALVKFDGMKDLLEGFIPYTGE